MSRFVPIFEALSNRGWAISSIELASDCWWAKEIWQLKSVWSPQGKTIYLSLLVNPLELGDPKKPSERSVWAVSLTESVPASTAEAVSATIQIDGRFSAAIDEILTMSDELRRGN